MFLNIISVARLLCLVLSVAALPSGTSVPSVVKALTGRNEALPGRELYASTSTAKLAKRLDIFSTRKSIDLEYSEEENIEGAPVVAATVHVESKTPILLLEEVEHLVDDIECRSDSISIHMLSHVARGVVHDAVLDLAYGGLVVTSHYGCNAQGERKLFRIENVTIDEDGSIISLHTKHADWSTSFRRFNVEIRHTKERHVHRRHQMPRVRRQEEASSTTIDLPTHSMPAPTATQTANDISLDVNYPFIDKDLPLPDDAGAGIHIRCKNCSTFGEIDFSFASFSLRDIGQGNDVSGLQLGDFFEGGEASIVTKKLGARVELEISLSNDGNLEVPLFEVPLLNALAIRGIGGVRLLYGPILHFAHTYNGTLNFTTGFEIDVPDNSEILIDLTEPSNSSASGFDKTTITSIPFQASIDVQTVQLSVALRHEVQMSFDFIDELSVEVGVYLDLPKFGAELTKKSGVDEDCRTLATSASENKDVAQKVLKEVLNVEPSVDWGVGIVGEISLLVAHGDFDSSFANGTFTDIDGQCLVFDRATGKYVDAKEVVRKAKEGNAAQLRVSSTALLGLALVAAVSALL